MGTLGLLTGTRQLPSVGPSPVHAGATLRPAAASRPNIILILTDDMRADDLPLLPAIQALLVRQGTTFSNAVVTTPGCAPARASLLRGQFAHNHGLRRGSGPNSGFGVFHDLRREESTVAVWLQEAGYRTALIGKYLNQYPSDDDQTYIPPGWDEWSGVTKEGYYGFEVNENGRLVRYSQFMGYATDVLASKATTFITRTAPTGQPFFLCVTPRAPHNPPEPAERHAMAFADTRAPRPPSFAGADLSAKARWVQALPELSAEDVAEIDAQYVARLRSLLAVDELVAGLVETLAELGVLENTYLVFTSDNGYHLGEHRIIKDKGTPYEEAIRVPLVIRGPGVPAGASLGALVSQVDLPVTFAAWAGAAPPAFVDGRSLAPLLERRATPVPWREAVLVEHYADRPESSPGRGKQATTRRRPPKGQPGFDALRTERFIYIEWLTGERELYDLVADPYQLNNQVESTDPELLAALAARLAELRQCTGDTCRSGEAAPLPRTLDSG
jgi:arylsulfatase A-like enzyme